MRCYWQTKYTTLIYIPFFIFPHNRHFFVHISPSVLEVWNAPAVELHSSHPKTLTHCFLNCLRCLITLSTQLILQSSPVLHCALFQVFGLLCPQSHACRLEWSHPFSPCCVQWRLFEDDPSEAQLGCSCSHLKMFHPSSNTARTHAHTSISTLKSLVNFCSRDFSLTINSMTARWRNDISLSAIFLGVILVTWCKLLTS